MLPFQQRNAQSHTSFFNSSHIIDSLRSASVRLSDKRSLSIHPFLITLLFNQLLERDHFTVLRFHSYFWICWSECEKRCLDRNESLFVSILSRKWSAHHPMDCERVWLHSIRYSQHLTGALAICDARRMRGIFTFINFTLWTQSILLIYRILQSGRSCDESVARVECDACGERNEHGEGRKEKRQRGWSPSLNWWCVLEDVQSLPPSGNW